MTTPKYYIGHMGNLFYASGRPLFLFGKAANENARDTSAAQGSLNQNKPAPVLRLRPDHVGNGKEPAARIDLQGGPQGDFNDTVSQSLEQFNGVGGDASSVQQPMTFPDGPWIRHPVEIDENCGLITEGMRDDITIEENRQRHKESIKKFLSGPKVNFPKILWVLSDPSAVDMTATNGADEELVDLLVERWFVNAPYYLQPGSAVPPSMRDHYHRDWSWNARGIYYRHHYSPQWVTGDHTLWVPTIDHVNWDDQSEEPRRIRAQNFLRHALDIARWRKSEYAWEADAWNDVFGRMRDDPTIAADKHEYNAVRSAAHPVSCLITDQSKFLTRIPDATFGLATFQPEHYQHAFASYDLDAKRLQALALHRNCGLLSDPRWGGSDLVFPFAVYEAKGWSGDPREARHQACSAAVAYLDLLDALARRPGMEGKMEGAYQASESRSSQVFALTSFGAHWHVMVGYRRPRLRREYAGRAGMSQNIYLFQRIWSGRISTERKAWELLSIVDQIHEWGITTHRDFVIRHLKPWHEFCKRSYVNDVDAVHSELYHSSPWDGRVLLFELPAWTQHLKADTRSKLYQTAGSLLQEAYSKHRLGTPQKSDYFPPLISCTIGSCGPAPGYPMSSPEEIMRHFQEFHDVQPDNSLTRRLNRVFRQAYNEADREQGLEKAVDEKGGESSGNHTTRDTSRSLNGEKRTRRKGADNEAPDPTSHKKPRL